MMKALPTELSLTYDFLTDAWVEDPLVMVRRGETEPPAPTSEPAPGKWHGKETPLPRPPSWHLPKTSRYLAAAALMLLLCLAFVAIPFVGSGLLCPFMVADVLLLGLGLSQLFSRRLAQPAAEPRDLRLLEHPDDPDVCLVQITIVRNDEVVGHDRGAAWFEDGRLLFSGHRTSFALGGEDLVPRSERGPRRREGQSVLPLRVDSGGASIEFVVLGYGERRASHGYRFLTRFGEFLFFAPPSRGPRQWPPLERG